MVKLYMWRSKLLQNYGEGYILAMAISVREARRQAAMRGVDYVRAHVKEIYGEEVSEDSKERIKTDLEILGQDLSAKPEVVLSGVYFVLGSD
jgi:hypothetical protein